MVVSVQINIKVPQSGTQDISSEILALLEDATNGLETFICPILVLVVSLPSYSGDHNRRKANMICVI